MEFKSSEVLILMMLAGGERYANELVKLFASRGVQTHRSTIHYVLRRFMQQKLVTTNGGREKKLRRYYRLTGRGHIELQRCLVLFDAFRSSRSLPGEPLQRVSGL